MEPPDHFGEVVAARYDDDESIFAPAVIDPMVDFLADLAGGGRALEFAIGTGRVALPLARRGVEVHGIDLSPAMLARLRTKPGGQELTVVIGDMASTRIDGSFSLVYLVFNTIGNLVSQEAQVECFRNAAAHLEEGGSFVIEMEVPQLQRLPPGQRILPFHIGESRLGFDEFDIVTQAAISHHVHLNDGGRYELFSLPWRYVWPAELDLMARLARLQLRERWGGWSREPFTERSAKHVSVWEKRAG